MDMEWYEILAYAVGVALILHFDKVIDFIKSLMKR